MIDKIRFTNLCLAAGIIFASMMGCSQNTPEAVFNRGVQHFQEKDFIAASIYFDDFITKFPDDERTMDAYGMLANSYMEMRDFGSARGVFQDLADKYAQADIVYNCSMQIGTTYAFEGNMPMAAAAFQSVIDATEDSSWRVNANWRMADAYGRARETDKANQYFEKIVKIADTEVEDVTQSFGLKISAYDRAGQIYQASQQFEKARVAYKKSLAVAESATQVQGVSEACQSAILKWAHTYALANDFITAATIYDHLQNNKYIQDSLKPQLVVWKIESLRRMLGDEKDYTPEETAVLVHEHQRLVNNFDNTDYGTSARVEIARLIKDSTPEQAEKYLGEAVERFEKIIAEPPSVDRPVLAMFQITDAYIKLEHWEDAKKTLDRIKLTYSDVPQAMQEVERLLQLIQNRQAEAEKSAESQ
jgi:TolA-binding protein